jgi:tetratricopeptide (TPR) repeat protein
MPPSSQFRIPPAHPHAAALAQRQRAAAARTQLNARDTAAWMELAALAIEAGDGEAAMALAAEAERLDRRNPRVNYLCGRAARTAGEIEEAIEYYRRALRLEPGLVEAWISLATCQRLEGLHELARDSLHKALQLAPERADIRLNLGNVHGDLADWPAAAKAYRVALEINPSLAGAREGLARALVQTCEFTEALQLLEALKDTGHAPYAVYQQLGRCRWLTGDPRGAREALVQAWRIALADPMLHPFIFMDLIVENEDPEAGLAVIEEALESSRDDAFLHQCRLDILVRSARMVDAFRQLKPIIESRSGDMNHAASAAHLGLYASDEQVAQSCCEYALERLEGQHRPEVSFTSGVLLLKLGDYPRGLPLFEDRLEGAVVRGLKARLDRFGRMWRGEDARGQRLLVWQEQGLGDVLQMLRFIPRLRDAGFAGQQWLVNRALVRLLETQPGIEHVTDRFMDLQAYDAHTPDMSLPFLMLNTLEDVPAPAGYLQAPAAESARWRAFLREDDTRMRVAIVWAGNPNLDADRFRSVPVADLAPLAAVKGVQWFNVQKGEPAAEFAGEPPFPCEDVRAGLRDFADTAGLFAQMDLVISVDSAPVHLAAALGRPTWLLNRSFSEWRWMIGREDSPWYPSLRLFNQREPRQWREVIERVAEALTELVREGPRR